jgi:hypothetical protein
MKRKKFIGEKKLEEFTYEELVSYVFYHLIDDFFKEGIQGLKTSIHFWMSQAILWSKKQKNWR